MRTERGLELVALCIGGFLLSIAYGVTFLIPLLVQSQGGDEALAGLIISAATISSIFMVIWSGHIADLLGTARAVAVSSLFLSSSAIGFALVEADTTMTFIGFILGIGWGPFYAIGPILITSIIESERRIKFFALLSGSMMAGISAGPIIGQITTELSLPIEFAFISASIASIGGGIIFICLHHILIKNQKIQPHISKISIHATFEIARSNAMYSIIMVGIGGGIFGGLSSFQTSYAEKYSLDYSLFFLGFMGAVIFCRLLIAGYVLKKDPFYSLIVLTSLTLIAIIMFMYWAHSPVLYFLTAVILGVGYGLTYSVINGLSAIEAPTNLIPQSLLLFSLSYLVGAFGFPLIAGNLIVSSGVETMLFSILMLAIASWSIVLLRIVLRAIKNN